MQDDKGGLTRRQYVKIGGVSVATVGVSGCIGSITGGGGGSMEIVAGTAPGFPPFEMKQGGELVGFDVKLLEAIIENTDYTLKTWKEFDFKTLIPALNDDKIDVIAAAMTITDKRDEAIDFTDSYYTGSQVVLVQKDSSFRPGKFDDLLEHTVGAQTGTTGEDLVKKKLIKKRDFSEENYKSFGNYVLAVEALQNGNVDAVIVSKPVAQSFKENRPVEITFTVSSGNHFGFGVRTGSDDLAQALNGGIEDVKESGKYDELLNKWVAKQNSG